MPHVTATVTKMRFVGSNSQVYYDNLLNRPTADFQNGQFFSKKHCHGR